MKIDIEFIFTYAEENVSWDIKKKVSQIVYKLKDYRTGERWVFDFIYRLDQDTKLYRDVVELYKKYPEEIEFLRLSYAIDLTKEEKQMAVAFIPLFPKYFCEEYEDIENKYEECSVCGIKKKDEMSFYVRPRGYIKNHQDDYGMAGLDGTGEIVLFPKLVKRLTEAGIDKKYFQPVLSKRKKVMGYIMVSKNILPPDSYKDPNYKLVGRCRLCGQIKLEEDEKEIWIRPRSIKGWEHMEDVNLSYEFFDDYRELIVSRKVEQIISKYVKYAEFLPVFERKNENRE